MITKDTLPQLLKMSCFTSRNGIFSKTFDAATLEVDTAKETIGYPKTEGLIVNEQQTCNFSANENFVVFECVHRLLEKGYKPEHIELEPKWKLGHGASGGRADILIKDNTGKPLLLIECKTPGREFDKAWRNTLQDGDQLFGYVEQIKATEFLCLYASDFENGILSYKSNIIAHRDNDKYLADNPLFKSYRDATDRKERFAVWRDTYKLDFTTKGIFEDNIQPYHIGKDKYTIADLHSISASDQQKKYHEFATILRQHNVSGRENAFDKLVNLFLCKLVDETENPNELKFYWKGVAYDTHFELLDRLQQLYQAGMGKFLGEDITYINQNDVNNALRFIRQNPGATQRAVWNLFVQQKFFTNNDFSSIDVHNEKLFYQNADVLLKILQMWQDIRLTGHNNHNQFLGDMFEGFLDQGVKQSEGQYFTPMPICRFILMSLPLESLIKGSPTPPKAIDYACGAGHFLNELAVQIKPLVELHKPGNLTDYHKAIYGIEKEYRLSKVAKVSAFMYGQQEINICYGDALINKHAAFPEIRDNSFDLLVANPPYSVRGFLETLPEEERAEYTLTATIDKLDTNNSIETFFIERAKQLLKTGGVAAIILPSSILSNGNNTYITTRSILLKFFDLVAIAEFGSGTFGKTGTNTVTLFLRRKGTAPDTALHYEEQVAEWFNSDDNQKVYQDAYLIDQYAAHIGVAAADYKTLLAGAPNAALLGHETFVQYRKSFDASTEIRNLTRQQGFRNKPHSEQQAELDKRLLAFVQGIEREHLTPLYDEADRDNAGKLNCCIADNFDGKLVAVPEELKEFAATARLVDMLDFSRVTFEKQIALIAKGSVTVQSRWPLVKIGDVSEIKNGGTPDTNTPAYWNDGDICWATLVDTKEKYLYDTQRKVTQAGLRYSTLLPVNSVIFSSRATIGEVCINKVPVATNQGYKNFICNPEVIHYEYLYYLLIHYRQTLENLVPSGSKYKEINAATIRDFLLPIPPLEIQQQIVTECEAVDAEATSAQAAIDAARQAIESTVNSILSSNHPVKKLNDICKMQAGKFVSPSEIADQKGESMFPCYGGNGLRGFTKTFTHDGTYPLIGRQGALCGNVNKADGKFHATEHAVVVTPNSDINVHWLYYQLKSLNLNQYATGAAQPGLSVKNILVVTTPVPPLTEQQLIVTEVEKLEKQIAEAQTIITAAPARKQAIMQWYL